MSLTDDVPSNASKNPLFQPHANVSLPLDDAAEDAAAQAGQTDRKFDQNQDNFKK